MIDDVDTALPPAAVRSLERCMKSASRIHLLAVKISAMIKAGDIAGANELLKQMKR